MERRETRGKETSGRDGENSKKGTTHNTQKNEDFLLENDPGGWTKTRILPTTLSFIYVGMRTQL